MPVLDPKALIEDRVAAIRAWHDRVRFRRAEVDVSGGVDSATVLALVCRALGEEHVAAVYTGIDSSHDSLARAREAAHASAVPLIEVEISDLFAQLTRRMLDALSSAGLDRAAIDAHVAADPAVLGSLRSCLRAPVGRGINRMTQGGIRHGTGNECEDRFLRFYQKGGDGEVDTNPIDMLSKGEVFQLARALGVPRRVREAIPSPDLHGIGAQHNDEDELWETYGVRWTYSKVDPDSGAYTFVGTIERMARLLDEPTVEQRLFADGPLRADDLREIAELGRRRAFAGYSQGEIEEFLLSARHIERATRHKWNPNCPSLGTRGDLLATGILTDDLPQP